MELSVQGHNVVIAKKLESHIRARAGRIERFLPGVEDVRVELRKQGAKKDAPHTVQLTVRRRKTILRVEEHNVDPQVAFDAALDKIYVRIARYKGRRTDRLQVGIPEDAELNEAEQLPVSALDAMNEFGEEQEGKVVRSKSFVIVPMSTDEAVEQMELLGHDFFVFMHDQDGKTKVVYRRNNGDYGLLQPEK